MGKGNIEIIEQDDILCDVCERICVAVARVQTTPARPPRGSVESARARGPQCVDLCRGCISQTLEVFKTRE